MPTNDRALIPKVLWEALSAFLIYRLGLRAKVLGSSRFRPLGGHRENTLYTPEILTSSVPTLVAEILVGASRRRRRQYHWALTPS